MPIMITYRLASLFRPDRPSSRGGERAPRIARPGRYENLAMTGFEVDRGAPSAIGIGPPLRFLPSSPSDLGRNTHRAAL